MVLHAEAGVVDALVEEGDQRAHEEDGETTGKVHGVVGYACFAKLRVLQEDERKVQTQGGHGEHVPRSFESTHHERYHRNEEIVGDLKKIKKGKKALELPKNFSFPVIDLHDKYKHTHLDRNGPQVELLPISWVHDRRAEERTADHSPSEKIVLGKHPSLVGKRDGAIDYKREIDAKEANDHVLERDLEELRELGAGVFVLNNQPIGEQERAELEKGRHGHEERVKHGRVALILGHVDDDDHEGRKAAICVQKVERFKLGHSCHFCMCACACVCVFDSTSLQVNFPFKLNKLD